MPQNIPVLGKNLQRSVEIKNTYNFEYGYGLFIIHARTFRKYAENPELNCQ